MSQFSSKKIRRQRAREKLATQDPMILLQDATLTVEAIIEAWAVLAAAGENPEKRWEALGGDAPTLTEVERSTWRLAARREIASLIRRAQSVKNWRNS